MTGDMSRPHRLSSYVGLGQYFLTICAYPESRPFVDRQVVAEVTTHFLQTAERERFELFAYCFMPDHMHALVTSRTETADFHRFVRLAKQLSGYAFRQSTGRRLWQDSFFDRTVRENESPVEIISYIVANPVRAGLARTPEDYPHWGSQIYSREEIVVFTSTESSRV